MRAFPVLAMLAAATFATVIAMPWAPAAAAGSTTADTAPRMPPKMAGARYGQALGSSLVCPFIRLMPAAAELMNRYDGTDLEAFKAEAQQVTVVWKKTLGCDPRADINRCRILSEKSCSEAVKEIGPEGTAATGLIEFRK